MTRIEILYSKKLLKLIIITLAIAFIISNYFIYFSNIYKDKENIKYLYIILDIYLIYVLYSNIYRLVKNKPFLIMTSEGIEINEKKEGTKYKWSEINNFGIESDNNDNGNYLFLETTTTRKKVNLNWLEKSPNQILDLIKDFKKIIAD